MPIVEAVTLVLAGGIFGWLLSRLPDVVVYVAMAALVVLVVVLLSRT